MIVCKRAWYTSGNYSRRAFLRHLGFGAGLSFMLSAASLVGPERLYNEFEDNADVPWIERDGIRVYGELKPFQIGDNLFTARVNTRAIAAIPDAIAQIFDVPEVADEFRRSYPLALVLHGRYANPLLARAEFHPADTATVPYISLNTRYLVDYYRGQRSSDFIRQYNDGTIYHEVFHVWQDFVDRFYPRHPTFSRAKLTQAVQTFLIGSGVGTGVSWSTGLVHEILPDKPNFKEVIELARRFLPPTVLGVLLTLYLTPTELPAYIYARIIAQQSAVSRFRGEFFHFVEALP